MNLEEDAMLVAIGRMGMDEAREKWADQWSDFCRSLTRWKSVHQMFRLGKLLSQMNSANISKATSVAALQIARNAQAQIVLIKKDMEAKRNLLKERRKTIQSQYDSINALGKPADLVQAFGVQKLGKSKKLHYDVDADWKVYVFGDPRSLEYQRVQKELDGLDDRFQLLRIEERKEQEAAVTAQIAYEKASDQYDVTKPYAMGLLVADVFYSLAAALQGDIY